MSRSRILSSIAAASIGIALLGACSAESLTERAVGFGLEQAIEGDQDIDLDFSDDGIGGFSISTDEGDFALSFDEDSGGIVFNTDEGDGVISFDEDGIVYDTDEGDGVISFDEDNGTITFDTDEGSGQINVDDENGTFTMTTEDGQIGIVSGAEVPASWPSYIGTPATLVPGSETYTVVELPGLGTSVNAEFSHAQNDPFGQQVVAALEANGWTGGSMPASDGGLNANFQKDGSRIQIVADPTNILITYMQMELQS